MIWLEFFVHFDEFNSDDQFNRANWNVMFLARTLYRLVHYQNAEFIGLSSSRRNSISSSRWNRSFA